MTTPAYPALQRGTNFTLLRGDSVTPTEGFVLVCSATTLDCKLAIETDDAMVVDCANPTNLPVRLSVAKGQTHDITFSGKTDYLRWGTLFTDYNTGVSRNYQLALAGTGAAGGGTLLVPAILVDLSLGKQENGMVCSPRRSRASMA